MENGERTALPDCWTSGEAGTFCLVCRRERAADAALEGAPEDSSHKARAEMRRDAIISFELSRDPQRPNAKIAQACRSSVAAIVSARRELGLPAAPTVSRPRGTA